MTGCEVRAVKEALVGLCFACGTPRSATRELRPLRAITALFHEPVSRMLHTTRTIFTARTSASDLLPGWLLLGGSVRGCGCNHPGTHQRSCDGDRGGGAGTGTGESGRGVGSVADVVAGRGFQRRGRRGGRDRRRGGCDCRGVFLCGWGDAHTRSGERHAEATGQIGAAGVDAAEASTIEGHQLVEVDAERDGHGLRQAARVQPAGQRIGLRQEEPVRRPGGMPCRCNAPWLPSPRGW